MKLSKLFILTSLVLGVCLSMTACSDSVFRKTKSPSPHEYIPWWSNVADYTYMWWAKGLRNPDKVFNIQTNRYGLSFDADAMQLLKLGPILNPISESEALTQDNGPIDTLPDAALEYAVIVDDQRYRIQRAGPLSENFQIIESGKYFQRRWLTKLTLESGAPSFDATDSGLEINAWPDRVAFVLHLTAKEHIKNADLEMRLTIPQQYTPIQENFAGIAFSNDDGSGYIVLTHAAEVNLSLDTDRRTCMVHYTTSESWEAGEERSIGLIVYPVAQLAYNLDDVYITETEPLSIEAKQVLPEAVILNVEYNRKLGWHYVQLRNDGDIADYSESSNGRIEQVSVTIHNPTPRPREIRLNFGKEGRVFGITGLSALLRDTDHNPLGIPIQLSKNWHNSSPDIELRAPFEGPWFHGLTMLTIPAETSISFEYVSVNALWGQLPAVSHAQLCLVGWGSNQLWDEAAIGSWGESLCFEPDQGQVGGAVLDSRPLMVWAMRDEPRLKWGWTNNVGGANFLVYYNEDVKKQFNSRMKTMYRRYCPNITEVTYAGTSDDGKIDIQYTVSLYRSDDITRGFYRFRYDIKAPVDFKRLVFFQVGADEYSYTGERKFAYGNEDGLIREWDTEWGSGQYRTERMELTGSVPWISMHEAVARSQKGAWANRGIVFRQWDAVLNGKPTNPWLAERGAYVRNEPTSLVEILPPAHVEQLQPGDYVEAEVVHLILPQYADDYYGPNTNLSQALHSWQNTWHMVYREAVGNELDINVRRGGTLIRAYPIQIQSTVGDISFDVTGGLGYVPVTFSNLVDYRNFQLEEKRNGEWVEIDQSHHGKDYWQTDYNPESIKWEITYSLPLDTPGDERIKKQFRLVVDKD